MIVRREFDIGRFPHRKHVTSIWLLGIIPLYIRIDKM